MSYGLYTKDLSGMSLSNTSLEACRRYLREGYVICTERWKPFGISFSVKWLGNWCLRYSKYARTLQIGPVAFSVEILRYLTADKIVEVGPNA